MSTSSRLTGVLKTSQEILFDDTSRFVFFSDCHRGDNSKADDFANNSEIYSSALEYYYTRGFSYIEIGDGDELWENDSFSTLFLAHKDIYLLMRKFHREGRLYMILGNHDIFKQNRNFVRKNLFKYYNTQTGGFEPLFDNIRIHEGLILRYYGTPYRIFVVHGHQGELFNDRLWPLARFFVRYLVRHFRLLRDNNPISPARNASRAEIIENNIMSWVKANNQMVIAGHTHRPAFAKPGEIPYFNDGCCVYPAYITCIEINGGEITLVKWSGKKLYSRLPEITRDIVAGPERIQNFFVRSIYRY